MSTSCFKKGNQTKWVNKRYTIDFLERVFSILKIVHIPAETEFKGKNWVFVACLSTNVPLLSTYLHTTYIDYRYLIHKK